jgi:TonB family protein
MKTWLMFLLIAGLGAQAQQPTTQVATKPASTASDAELDVASQMVGRALFLRCFCAENNLTFDAQGHVSGSVKKTDWTLSGVNVLKVSRKGANEIELDGVRVAVRYATDRHEFDRKPQNDEAMHMTIMASGSAAEFEKTLAAVFATGIDRPLQLSMTPAWRHYFDPATPWPNDEITGQTVLSVATSTADVTIAAVTHRADAEYHMIAARDHVAGIVKLRFVVDAQGEPKRIAIMQPIGYGLDEKAAEAVAKYRFTPATYKGKAMASNVSIDEEFKFVAMPQ